MSQIALTCGLLLGAAFEVLSFPLPALGAEFFAARIEPTGPAEIFVLHKNSLTVYLDSNPDSAVTVALRPGTTAVDVADVNGDGRNEVIGIAGQSIVRYNLPIPSTPDGTELFQLDTQFSKAVSPPFLQVLVVQQDGVPMLALPTENTLDLRTPSGSLVRSLPLQADSANAVAYSTPFTIRMSDPPQLGPAGALEMRVRMQLAYSSELTPAFGDTEHAGMFRRRGTSRQMLEAAGAPPDSWPWFPLRREGASQDRVLYAAADSDFRDILIRVRTPQTIPETGEQGLQAGPARRYPGMLVRRDLQQPDFNGDGFADLILWSPAEPSISLNALTRAAAQGHWPIALRVHLFMPDKLRFDPRTASAVRLQSPIAWYLDSPTEAPLANVVFADFNGDTRSDFGCSTSATSFSIWLFHEESLPESPDFTHDFGEPLQELLFSAAMRDRSRAAVALKGAEHVYLLVPGDALPSFPPPIQTPPPAGSAATSPATVFGTP